MAGHDQLFNPKYQATIREINRGSNRDTRAMSMKVKKADSEVSAGSLAQSIEFDDN